MSPRTNRPESEDFLRRLQSSDSDVVYEELQRLVVSVTKAPSSLSSACREVLAQLYNAGYADSSELAILVALNPSPTLLECYLDIVRRITELNPRDAKLKWNELGYLINSVELWVSDVEVDCREAIRHLLVSLRSSETFRLESLILTARLFGGESEKDAWAEVAQQYVCESESMSPEGAFGLQSVMRDDLLTKQELDVVNEKLILIGQQTIPTEEDVLKSTRKHLSKLRQQLND